MTDDAGQRPPRLAVVVVTHQSSAVIRGLFESLPEGLRGTAWQLVVVDNASTDSTVALARELVPGARIVQMGRNAGYAAAFNAGVAAADRFDAAMVVNPDVRLGPGSARAMYRELGRAYGATRVGIAAPRIWDGDGNLAYSLRREPTVARALGEAVLGHCAGRRPALGQTVFDDLAYRQITAVDWATGANLLISAECLAATGPWDESFFLYSEETDFALRARDRGFSTVIVPDAGVTHLGGQSSGEEVGNAELSPRLWSILTLSKVRLYRKRHPWPAAAAYWTAVFLAESVSAALGRPHGRRAMAALLRPSKVELG
uniref:Glycosyl transferase, family 2 n=1 Tax=uncultured bacterium esnapd14 TaxID=1366594 RepID=S5UCN2_9BACT|nr:glycosyl transferase, family 2 [uncultured bacterium esnapd14]